MFRRIMAILLITICTQGCFERILLHRPTSDKIVIVIADVSKMSLIPEGPFSMGSFGLGKGTNSQVYEEVTLEAYYIDKYEVTIGEYVKFQEESGHPTPEDPYSQLRSIFDFNKGGHRYPENPAGLPYYKLLHTMMQ